MRSLSNNTKPSSLTEIRPLVEKILQNISNFDAKQANKYLFSLNEQLKELKENSPEYKEI